MEVPYRPLGLLKQLLEEIGGEISYVYEDLIFLNHNVYLLQFGSGGNLLSFHANQEASAEDAQSAFETFSCAASGRGFVTTFEGSYTLTQEEGETINLHFHPRKAN